MAGVTWEGHKEQIAGSSLGSGSCRLPDSPSPFWKACREGKEHKHNSSSSESPCLCTLALQGSRNHLHLFCLIF